MKTQNSIGLNKKHTEKTAEALNQLLADLHIFYQNLRGFHWNIKGPRFFSLHEKFEGYYDEVAADIDEVAERILTLGHTPLHTLSEYIKKATLKEAKNISKGDEALAQTLEGFQHLLAVERNVLNLADEQGDEGTNALMSDLISKQEKHCWMLSSVLNE
jgi:starvation-inducible DNA-binding protein